MRNPSLQILIVTLFICSITCDVKTPETWKRESLQGIDRPLKKDWKQKAYLKFKKLSKSTVATKLCVAIKKRKIWVPIGEKCILNLINESNKLVEGGKIQYTNIRQKESKFFQEFIIDMVLKIESLKCNKEVHYNKMRSLNSPEKLVSAQACVDDTKKIYDKVEIFNSKYEIFEKVSFEASRLKGGCKNNQECNTQRKELDSLVNPMVNSVHRYQEHCMKEDFQRLLESTIDETSALNKPESDLEIECKVPSTESLLF